MESQSSAAQFDERWMRDLPVAVIVLCPRGRIRSCNPQACTLFGCDPQGIQWRAWMQTWLQPGGEDPSVLTTRDGRKMGLWTQALAKEPGQMVVMVDLTSLGWYQTQKNQAETMQKLGRMAAYLAHEIKTPLASAMLYVHALCKAQVPEEEVPETLDLVHDRLQHLNALVHHMLLLTQGQKPILEPLSVTALIEKACVLCDRAVQASNIDCDPQLMLYGSQEGLLSALKNMIQNAIEASPEENSIHIIARRQDAEIWIEVWDQGPGWGSASKEPQWAQSSKAQGHGLGLMVIQSVAQAHQGRFALVRDHEQTCARLMLPLIGATTTSTAKEAAYA